MDMDGEEAPAWTTTRRRTAWGQVLIDWTQTWFEAELPKECGFEWASERFSEAGTCICTMCCCSFPTEISEESFRTGLGIRRNRRICSADWRPG